MLRARGYGKPRRRQESLVGEDSTASTKPFPSYNGGALFYALAATWPLLFWAIGFFLLVSTISSFGVPLALKYLVNFIGHYASEDKIPTQAYVAAAVLFLAPALSAFCNVLQYQISRRLIFRWRAALIGLIFRQMLRIDPSVASYSSGQVINLCSVDANTCDILRQFHFIWCMPMEVMVSIGLIFWVLKSWISGLVGVVLMSLGVYLTVKVSERLRKAQKALMKRKDGRLSLLGEGLHGMRAIKLLAWERDFLLKVRHMPLRLYPRYHIYTC